MHRLFVHQLLIQPDNIGPFRSISRHKLSFRWIVSADCVSIAITKVDLVTNDRTTWFWRLHHWTDVRSYMVQGSIFIEIPQNNSVLLGSCFLSWNLELKSFKICPRRHHTYRMACRGTRIVDVIERKLTEDIGIPNSSSAEIESSVWKSIPLYTYASLSDEITTHHC